MDNVPEQARFVVLDLGGGTVDVTVVDRDRGTLKLVGRPAGREDIGGEDYDRRLARWMVEEAGAPGLYDRLASSGDPDEREQAVEIRTHARYVKEELSKRAVVAAQLPDSPPELTQPTPVQVSRTQLENLIGGGPGHEAGLADAVQLVTTALNQAPPGPSFAGVFLTGGCARIPMLGALVQQRTGLRPLNYGDPTTSVARGAAEFGYKSLEPPSPMPEMPALGAQPKRARSWSRRLRRIAVITAVIITALVSGLIALAIIDPTPTPTPCAAGPIISSLADCHHPPHPVPDSPPPTPPAGQIASDTIGETTESGATVTNAVCSPDTVQRYSNGSMQAECDLTLSTLATYRASVTDNGNGTTFDFQYQENISVGEIQQAVIGLEAQNGSTVSASTCYSDTMRVIQLAA